MATAPIFKTQALRAIDDSALSAVHKTIAKAAVSFLQGDSRVMRASVPSIAERSQFCERTVRRALVAMVDAGLFVRTERHRQQHPARYRITLPERVVDKPAQTGLQSGLRVQSGAGSDTTPRVDSESARVDSESTESFKNLQQQQHAAAAPPEGAERETQKPPIDMAAVQWLRGLLPLLPENVRAKLTSRVRAAAELLLAADWSPEDAAERLVEPNMSNLGGGWLVTALEALALEESPSVIADREAEQEAAEEAARLVRVAEMLERQRHTCRFCDNPVVPPEVQCDWCKAVAVRGGEFADRYQAELTVRGHGTMESYERKMLVDYAGDLTATIPADCLLSALLRQPMLVNRMMRPEVYKIFSSAKKEARAEMELIGATA